MKKEILIVLLLLLISFPALRSLFLPGGFTSHDLTHHVIRQISMDKLLSEGQFPPRWSGELNNGFGYPLFLFNYPLPALLGEVFHKLGLGFVDSVKAVLLFSMIVSEIGMFLFLNSLLKSKLAAFLGAVFYLYAPYRFSVIYVSTAVGSALALGLVPFVFWSLVEIKKGKKWAILVGALSLAGLILAHNVTALIFAPVLAVFGLVLAWEIRGYRGLRGFWGMMVLGLGLSAWFWLPAAVEKQYIRFDTIYAGFYKDQFISLWQLLRSPWGYGLSHPMNPEPGDMSYQLGLAQIAVVGVLGASLFFRRIRGLRGIRILGGFTLIAFALSVFLMLKVSLPLWDTLPFLSLVQFPYRFASISIFCAAIAASLLVKYLPFKKVVFLALLVLVIYANRNHWNINQIFDPGEQYYLALKTSSTTYGEHLPKWGKLTDKTPKAKLEGVGGLEVLEDKSGRVIVEVEASQAATLRLNQIYFPGWEIKVDGKEVVFNYLADGESYGLPLFDIAVGKHVVSAEFKNTPVRNLGDGITIVTVIIVFAITSRRFLAL